MSIRGDGSGSSRTPRASAQESSYAADSSHSAPSYHYHGLADTQTPPVSNTTAATGPVKQSSLGSWDGVLASPVSTPPIYSKPLSYRPIPVEDSFGDSVYNATPIRDLPSNDPSSRPLNQRAFMQDQGRVLVENTPSETGSRHSQPYDDSIDYNEDVHGYGQREEDHEPSNNYSDVSFSSMGDLDEEPPGIPAKPASIPDIPDYYPGMVDEPMEDEPTQIVDVDAPDASDVFTTTASQAAIPANNSWDYVPKQFPAGYDAPSRPPAASHFTRDPSQEEETQPTEERYQPPGWKYAPPPLLPERQQAEKESATKASTSIPASRKLRSKNQTSPIRDRSPQSKPRTAPDFDSMDVVPDSEPSRQNYSQTSNLSYEDVPRGDPQQSIKGKVVSERSTRRLRREESSEIDIPLLSALKSKGKAVVQQRPPEPTVHSTATKTKGKAVARRQDMDEVPSSFPGEEAIAAKTIKRERPTSGSDDVTTSRSPSANQSTASKRRKVAQKAKQKKATRDDSEEESSHDEDVRDVSPKKRTRGAAAASSVQKDKKSTVKKQARTPARRNAQPSGPATSVFALWKEDGFYYAGTVESLDGRRYKISFSDGSFDSVDIGHMRPNDLQSGDEVLVDNDLYTVKSVDGDSVQVVSEEGPTAVDIFQIRIASNTIERAWLDRKLNPDNIVAASMPIHIKAPLSKTGKRGKTGAKRKLFESIAFVLTSSVQKASTGATKDLLKNDTDICITDHGGTVFAEWSNAINFAGSYKSQNRSWSLEKRDARWLGSGIKKLFLLSDDHCTKTKYLTALALGVPCIKMEFINECVEAGELLEWDDYLLDQGTSIFGTSAIRVSQHLDLNWCMDKGDLDEIMESKVASKLLADKVILCLGAEYVPPTRSTRKGDSKKTSAADDHPSTRVPPVILSMGARFVEAATALEYVSRALEDFDYIVVKDEADMVPELDREKTVSFGWVKNSLILGRLLSLDSYRLTP